MQDYDKDGTLHYQTIFIALMYSLARGLREHNVTSNDASTSGIHMKMYMKNISSSLAQTAVYLN